MEREFSREGVNASARVFDRMDFVRGGRSLVMNVGSAGTMNLEEARRYLEMVSEAVAYLESLEN